MQNITQDIVVMLREGDLDDDLSTIEDAVRARKLSRQFGSRYAYGNKVRLNHMARPKALVGIEGTIKKVNPKTIVMDFPDDPTLGHKWNGARNVKVPKSLVDVID